MLQIKNIKKEYHTGTLIQKALDDVSLSFRDNELVSVLGPSGSGKTTLLNIVGGLDSYDSGDLIINGVSTKNYKDRDWDTYRNYTIGFVFQSYNLIPHQSVLGNVELALTIGGITKKESKKRAIEALTKVGLKDHIYKRPNQLSGGQMQRVAIARALVNDPDILLADEPTGALDSETSTQIMGLLKEVANDRLVIMVTHNPELAAEYSTRIVKLKDGKIIDDSNPFDIEKYTGEISQLNYIKKSKMSWFTSLGLSFKNLTTKKRRTLLTAFAGSIGIIGISLILSLSTGVNEYIDTLQSDTMSSYPIKIDAQATVIPTMTQEGLESLENNYETDGVYMDYTTLKVSSAMSATNNLTEFKKYLEDETNNITEHLGENGIVYSYETQYDIYTYDSEGKLVNTATDVSTLTDSDLEMPTPQNNPMTQMMGMTSGNFSEMLKSTEEGKFVNNAIIESYDMINGRWPENENELILFVDDDNTVGIDTLYQLGYITADEYKDIAEKIENEETVDTIKFDYTKVLDQSFYLLTSNERYVKNDGEDTFKYLDEEFYTTNEETLKEGLELKIVGVAKLKEDVSEDLVTTSIGYTTALTEYIIEKSNESEVVKAQEASKDVNILTGMSFEALTDEEKIEDTKEYISGLGVSEKATMYTNIMYASASAGGSSAQMGAMTGSQMPSEATLASMMDKWLVDSPDSTVLLAIYDSVIDGATYNGNMSDFGKINYDSPSSISIYTDSFEAKDSITAAIADYNTDVEEENQIVYTDFIELLTSSMTSMIDVISYVLIAFVSVSLVVSCIMIGIITHISVMERTKEIGVLRALGASKRNISQVFNAETILIGLCSGFIGIATTVLLNIPITAVIQTLVENDSIVVSLPMISIAILVVLSVLITVIGGLLPAKNAAKKDPVIALRTE